MSTTDRAVGAQERQHEHQLLGRDDVPLTISGTLLGFATSKREIHSHSINFTDEDSINEELELQAARLSEIERGNRLLTPTMRAVATASLKQYIDDLETAESPVRYATAGDRCSACRWFEVRIFRANEEYVPGDKPRWESASAKYLVVTYGLSDVPGEVAKRRAQWTDSPFAVIEMLTQRRGNTAFLPATSARVLSEAAACDDNIANAYVNRAVA